MSAWGSNTTSPTVPVYTNGDLATSGTFASDLWASDGPYIIFDTHPDPYPGTQAARVLKEKQTRDRSAAEAHHDLISRSVRAPQKPKLKGYERRKAFADAPRIPCYRGARPR